MSPSAAARVDLALHAKQALALQTEATEVLYGGAAGGGKSHLMRSAAVIWSASIPGLQVYLFRRIEDDLVKNHVEGPKGLRSMLAPWSNAGFCDVIDGEVRFWNSSKIFLCHCKDERHIYKYQGAEMHVLMIDELTHFTEPMYRFLRGRVRMVGLPLPAEHAGRFPRIVCSANPGNVGHHFVKATFIDGVEPMAIRRMPAAEGGMLRQYIPARLDDNPSMAVDDPSYGARLSGLGSEALVRAMRDGDWDVVEGAYFDCWDAQRHVIRPFEIPEHWLRFRSFDWGGASPFSVQWWAVSDGATLPDGRQYPAGALLLYREWYGAKGPNVGIKLPVEEIAQGILERQAPGEERLIRYSVADPSIFAEDGGPSMAERMGSVGVWWQKADNKRVPARGHLGGWDQVRARLVGQDGRPMLYVFATCRDVIRTLPALQHDVRVPEDVDTTGEDHSADALRYACMSRPWTQQAPVKPPPRDRWDRAFSRFEQEEESWKVA